MTPDEEQVRVQGDTSPVGPSRRAVGELGEV